ncbi:MAG TPA: AMP-binding protein [Ohtaekwangia sp.]|uniref:AMP-binding protein n=1 Tax=Ohtaekwangia sp. TaxID=2066019 RepID=UPI002F92BB84
MSYPYPSILINGREVLLEQIKQGAAMGNSEFETATFDFIQRWLNDEPSFDIYTSGSTGTPKKISLARSQMVVSAQMTAQALSLQPGYTALVCLNTHYIAGKMMLVRCLTTGMRIVASDPNANPLASIPPGIVIDFTAWVPYQVYEVLASPYASRLNAIKHIIIGGAPLNREVLATLQSYSCRFYATYGMTETISHIALQSLNGPDASEVFHALPGVKVYTDDRGCLVIEAPHLSGSIITNDLVEMKGPDSFVWRGRWDNIINSGGVKIIPEKVEYIASHVLAKCGVNRSFFIAALPDEKLGQKIILLLEGEADLDGILRDLIYKEFKQTVSVYEVPRDILVVDTFLYTNTGKIDRRKTIEMITNRS